MKSINKLIIFLIIITLYSCSGNEKKGSIIQETDQEQEMISAYNEGIKSLASGDAFYAAKSFLEAELLFPQSELASKSALMAAYSYYIQDYYSEAMFNLERFIKTYPLDNRMDYVHYLLAMCYYENIEGEKKDLQPLITAKKEFNFIITNYPGTDFALDSKFKISLINDILASKEMYIARHYIKKEKWISAINRFKIILNDYDTTVYTEEAIHRLVEVYYKIGLEEEAKKYAVLLGYNYQSSDWYKRSYKIFDEKYEIKKVKIEKKGIIKKFKKLF